MWVCEVAGSDEPLHIRGTVNMGRHEQCHISFSSDKSVSRSHAELRLRKENDVLKLFLLDMGSKYGCKIGSRPSVVVRGKAEVELLPGDEIILGMGSSRLRVSFHTLSLCITRLSKADTEAIRSCATVIGAKFISNLSCLSSSSNLVSQSVPSAVLISNQFSASVKAVQAVALGIPFVSCSWLTSFASNTPVGISEGDQNSESDAADKDGSSTEVLRAIHPTLAYSLISSSDPATSPQSLSRAELLSHILVITLPPSYLSQSAQAGQSSLEFDCVFSACGAEMFTLDDSHLCDLSLLTASLIKHPSLSSLSGRRQICLFSEDVSKKSVAGIAAVLAQLAQSLSGPPAVSINVSQLAASVLKAELVLLSPLPLLPPQSLSQNSPVKVSESRKQVKVENEVELKSESKLIPVVNKSPIKKTKRTDETKNNVENKKRDQESSQISSKKIKLESDQKAKKVIENESENWVKKNVAETVEEENNENFCDNVKVEDFAEKNEEKVNDGWFVPIEESQKIKIANNKREKLRHEQKKSSMTETENKNINFSTPAPTVEIDLKMKETIKLKKETEKNGTNGTNGADAMSLSEGKLKDVRRFKKNLIRIPLDRVGCAAMETVFPRGCPEEFASVKAMQRLKASLGEEMFSDDGEKRGKRNASSALAAKKLFERNTKSKASEVLYFAD